jgi:hypothetical protein
MLNHMKKQNGRKMKKTATKQLIYNSIYIAAAIIFVFFLYYNITKEERGFMSLRQDMKSLETSFNTLDNGWVYSESCRGKGGDFDRDVPSSCAISISNDKTDFSVNQKQRVNNYSELIVKSGYFALRDNIKEYDQSSYFVAYNYSKLYKPNCSLQSYKSDDNSNNKVSLTFGCIAESSKFYFERND